MPSDVNPFEPWRPPGAGRTDDDMVHPWNAARPDHRPPPDDDREVPYYQRRAGHPGPEDPGDAPRPPSGPNGLLLILFLILALAGLGALGSLGGGHAARVGAVTGTLFVGAVVGLSVLSRSRWYVRAGACAVGCAASLASYYFVPTTSGLTLWAANARVAGLRQVAPGDFAAFAAARPGIAEVRRDFNLLEVEVAVAESSWAVRTAAGALAEVDAVRANDPFAALDRLARVEEAFTSVGQLQAVRPALQRGYTQAATAALDRLEADCARLTAAGRFLHAQELLTEQGKTLSGVLGAGVADIEGRLTGIRQAVFRAHLHAGGKLLERLVGEGRWDEVTREARRLTADLTVTAGPRNDAASIRAALDGPRRAAVRGRLAAAVAAAGEKAAAAEYAEAERIAAREGAAMRDEARALRMGDEVERGLAPLRRQALEGRLAAGGRDLRGLLAGKEYAAVAARGAALYADLSGPAAELGLTDRLAGAVNGPRREALRARLERVREEIVGLLVKDRYADVGKAGVRAEVELAAEADRLKVRGELDAVVKRCMVIGRLAELAGRK